MDDFLLTPGEIQREFDELYPGVSPFEPSNIPESYFSIAKAQLQKLIDRGDIRVEVKEKVEYYNHNGKQIKYTKRKYISLSEVIE